MGLPLHHFPTSNTDAVVNIAALGESACIEIESIDCAYDGAPTAGLIKVESPVGTIIWQLPVTSAGPAPIKESGSCLACPVGQAARVTLAAGGSGVTGYLNVIVRMDSQGQVGPRPAGS